MASDHKNTLKRVGENLYVNGHGTYFAWFSKGGKQIKLSLKTQDKALARRRLADKRESATSLRDNVDRSMRFEDLAKLWLESITSEVKLSTHSRRQVCVKQIAPFSKEFR